MDSHRKGPAYSFSAWTLKKGAEISAKKATGASALGDQIKVAAAWFGVYLLMGLVIWLIIVFLTLVVGGLFKLVDSGYNADSGSGYVTTPYGTIAVSGMYTNGMKGKRDGMAGRPGRERMLARPVRR